MAGFLSVFRGNLTLTIGTIMLLLIVLMAIFAPFLGTVDPSLIRAEMRGANPSAEHWLGGDMLGRDIYSRAIYGARVSLIVGFGVAFLSTVVGVALGLIAGFVRWADPLIMRVMDGLMAIPTILIAIAMIAVAGVSLTNVIISITLAEVPRLVRLVRASVLSLREQPYVEVAAASGASKQDADHLQTPAAERHRADHRHRDLSDRAGDPVRGGPVVPGCRHPADHADLGQYDVRGARPVAGETASGDDPRRIPECDHPCHQPDR
ncbi:binding-protein-dependent transport systems inner membrane component [Ketogulonicigenium vulgare Y25]|nr:binding-protein-dependent transport systems inner membrane component [Ketogulonicigenium vulgare Y25]